VPGAGTPRNPLVPVDPSGLERRREAECHADAENHDDGSPEAPVTDEAPEGVARVPNEPVDGRGASNLSVRFLSCARCDQVPAFVLARHARRLEPYDSDDEPGFVEAWVDHVRHAENLHLIATEKGAHHPQLGGKTSAGAHRQ